MTDDEIDEGRLYYYGKQDWLLIDTDQASWRGAYKRDATYSSYTQDAQWLVERIVESWLHGEIGPGRVTCRMPDIEVTVEFGRGCERNEGGE